MPAVPGATSKSAGEMPKDELALAVILLDYDNLKPIDEISTKDVADNLIQMREWIAVVLPQVPVKINEVSLRIYGGWTDERGALTRRANWVLAGLSQIRGLVNGVRFSPTLPVSTAAQSVRLRGMYRKNQPKPEQKMVDTLMAVDAIHFSSGEFLVVAIATDDDDLVPALLAASAKPGKTCCLLRFRKDGEGLNDASLPRRPPKFLHLWPPQTPPP